MNSKHKRLQLRKRGIRELFVIYHPEKGEIKPREQCTPYQSLFCLILGRIILLERYEGICKRCRCRKITLSIAVFCLILHIWSFLLDL